jgi:hypothetical protein
MQLQQASIKRVRRIERDARELGERIVLSEVRHEIRRRGGQV